MRWTLMRVLTTAVLIFSASLGQEASPPSTMVGFISDTKCGAEGAHAYHKDCAIQCVTRQGQNWAFVSSDDRVFKVQNQKVVSKSDLGHEVVVTGRITDDGSLYIDTIRPRKTR